MTSDSTIFDPNAARDELTSRLHAFRRRVWWHVAVAGIARIVATAAGLALLSFVIDRVFRLSVGVRLPLLALGAAVLVYEAWRLVVWPLTRKVSFVDLADALDRSRPRTPLAPRIASVLELTGLLQATAPPSGAMVRAAVQNASRSLADVDFSDRLDHQRLRLHTGAIAGVLLLSIVLAIAAPTTMSRWARRWFAASSDPWPQKTYLEFAGLSRDGRLLVPRGEAATLRVNVTYGSRVMPETVSLHTRAAEGRSKRVDAMMTRFNPAEFRHELPPVYVPLLIEAEGGDDAIGPIRVEPVDRPQIARMELTAQHPLDAAPSKHDFTAASEHDLAFLPHTTMRLMIESTVPIQFLSLGETGNTVRLSRMSDTRWTAEWTHEKPAAFKIELTGAATGLTSIVTPLTIGLKADQAPRVSLAYTGVRQRVTPTATIPLTINARDDFGVHDVQLSSRLEYVDSQQKRQTTDASAALFGPQSPAVETDVQLQNRFSIASLKPPVGALVSLTAAASDARYKEPQAARSREAAFRIVAPEELFREILLRQQGERAKFRKVSDEAQKLKQDIAVMGTAADAASIGRRHRVLQRETARIATSLAESLTEMQLNQLGSVEAYELMQKNILAPMKTLNDGLLNQQRDALDAMAAGGPLAVESAAARQEEIASQIAAILKQMAQWDSFVDVLNQLNEIIRLQEQAKQTTDQLKAKQADSVFDQ